MSDELFKNNESLRFDDSHPLDTQKQTEETIDTSTIDGYRQGIEIRTERQYCKGLEKIWSGDPGHVVKQANIGAGTNSQRINKFQEKESFDPVTFLEAQTGLIELSSSVTFPIMVGDNDQEENENMNGILEPLTIRDAASFSSIESPFIARSTKGALMSGNEDETWWSDRVVSVDQFTTNRAQNDYIDMVDMLNGTIPMNGTFHVLKATTEPFVDERPIRNTSLLSGTFAELDAALSIMTGSTDNYVTYDEFSMSTGFWFNNDGIGVDSITFGDLSY